MPDVALKKGWARIRFGEAVRLSGERSSNPEKDGFERFVGLEHIDPGDLKIRSWGDIANGTTFTSVFRPGQVLFGKRRAYQRKVAVADFNGVCSSDIYVLQPRSNRLLPEFLPFICQTDGFFEHAVGTSAGSLSPRTNWDSLESYELALPPIDDQHRIVRILQVCEAYAGLHRDLCHAADQLLPAYQKHLMSVVSPRPSSTTKSTALVRLGDVLNLERNEVRLRPGKLYREIGIRSFGRGIFHKDAVPSASLGTKRVFAIEPNRLVLNIVFAWEGAVAVTSENDVGFIASHRFPTYVSKSEDVDIRYVYEYLLTPEGIEKLGRASPGGAGRNRTLGQKSFLEIVVPIPPRSLQERYVRELRELRAGLIAARDRNFSCQRLKVYWINYLQDSDRSR